ncbi:MAG: hypothetical protein ACRD1C_01935 [Terriglobales bacterium]
MPSKSVSVRISTEAPEIDSTQLAVWLDDQLTKPAPLAPDPGAGELTLRLSLDAGKVKDAAKAAGESEAVFLRRLIASNVSVPTEGPRESEAKPKPLVLRGNLRLRQEQLRPLVGAFDGVQSFMIRRALKAPDATKEAALTTEERDRLAANLAETLNRRAPARLAANVDLIGLALDLVATSWQKIDGVKAAAERKRKQRDAAQSGQQATTEFAAAQSAFVQDQQAEDVS